MAAPFLADPPAPGGTFFDLQSFLSLASASAMVIVVTSVCERVFHFRHEWFTLLISIAIALIGVAVRSIVLPRSPKPGPIDYAIGVLNGFLVYTTAVGAASAASHINFDGWLRYLNS